ncbi:MAG: L-threonylcarbamoyladenylate synthase [Candidatus Omnitrophota bacterium]|nr:L-threonylcarbamoyladenylate synthase [Candidatus Omnitrophota bacterium]
MVTEILKIDAYAPDISKIKKASQIIKEGALVAFPTETVYGLGADALNPVACAKIFQAKKRPLEDPLIVHIADKQDLFKVAREVDKITLDLIGEFWPGPLTLVLKKQEAIPDIVTGGLDTVAVRMPNYKIALSLIKEAKTPVAAPSANLFGRPSPTSAQHVLEDLDGKIDLVIDGGSANIGVESTIVDLTREPFSILRPGGIGIEELRRIIPQIEFYKKDGILSAGMYPRHYAPNAKILIVEGNGKTQVEKVKDLAREFDLRGYRFGILAKFENKDRYGDFNVKLFGPGNDAVLCAANLFSALRDFDQDQVDVIIAEGVKEEGLGAAIMDRLRRASVVSEKDV